MMIFEPLDESDFGAVVLNVDLSNFTQDQFKEINEKFLRHKILIFRDQGHLSVEAQREFSLLFGELHSHIEKSSHHPQYPDVNIVSNIANAVRISQGGHNEEYHSDLSWWHMPTKITMLRSEVTPAYGGETYFVDSTRAYADLPEEWKQRVHGLKGVYSYLKWRNFVPGYKDEELDPKVKSGAEHPLVITHPETGVKNIYANHGHCFFVKDVSKEESDEILGFLAQHVDQPKYRYTHWWKDGELVMWDNRAVQHKATVNPSDARRLIRTTVRNDDVPREELFSAPHVEVQVDAVAPSGDLPTTVFTAAPISS